MLDFNKQELEILSFWKEKDIFNKLRKQINGKKRWSFLDGPITSNNPMAVHHAWGRTYKDLFHRFKAMNGFEMRYQNGFDCQGLWVEREEEKDLGLKTKSDIERFGILNFVQACKKRVEKFSKIQTNQSIRLGQWMDWNNSYYTMTDNNNLHNWFLLKQYFEKGWLYKGKDSVPWCWRCGTASSKHDIVTEGYKEVTHTALFMQFPVKGKDNEYFLIFTTTPWTVPANVAIAVNEKLVYAKIKHNEKYYWLAESTLKELEGEYEIIEKKKGEQLKGISYIMPYSDLEPQKNSPHKVVLWDLASGEEGTGIVHIAPGCGAEDFDLGKNLKLNSISPLDESGVYSEGYGEFTFKKYSDVNKAVLKDMEERNYIYKIKPYKHRYPHCWRCGEELVFRMVDEWYIKCKDIRPKLIKENKKIKWFPAYGQKRQQDWFENMGDWLISRKRYWGLPLPIWECKCGNIEVIGSLEELKQKAIDEKKVESLPEMHRPWIDEIKIKCSKCGKEVERIKDVGDAWLDAGIVPFSTLNYLKDKEYWEKWYPFDMISENLPGQYRGWFNAISWSGVALSNKIPFKSMFGYETLKDEKGEEMHKSKGNAIWFDDAAEKIGVDPMRLLFCMQDPSQELRFGFNVVKEPKNQLNILWNISKLLISNAKKSKKLSIEDKWIISRLNSLIFNVTNELNEMHPHLASRALADFWIEDLSRGYIQVVRDRLSEEDTAAYSILSEVYLTLIKLCAPFIPFITEKIWQEIKQKSELKEESIHLCSWPKPKQSLIDEDLELRFENAKKIIEICLAEREKSGMPLKQPLSKVAIETSENIGEEIPYIIAKMLNVKNIEIIKTKEKEIKAKFDLSITPELEAEGLAREISRKIQEERKKAGLNKKDKIELYIFTDDKISEKLILVKGLLSKRTNSKKIFFIQKIQEQCKFCSEFEIKNKKTSIFFNKVN